MPDRVYGSPSLRLVQLYMLLCSSGREYSLTRLSKMFGCSRQSVLRMLEQLQLLRDVKVESWMDGRERYYRIPRRKHTVPLALDPDTLKHLAMCQEIVRHLLPAKIKEELRQAIGTVAEQALGATGKREALNPFAGSMAKGVIEYTPHQKTIEVIQSAMEETRLCRVEYRSKMGDALKSHYVGPLKIIAFREAFYLRCHTYDAYGRPLKDKPKAITLAVHRIHKITPCDREFTPLPDDDTTGLFGFHFEEPFQVKVAFTRELATYISERTWSRGQHIKKQRDGGVVLTFTATSTPEVKAFVMGCGSAATLLEPAALRKELERELAAAAKNYRE